MLERLRSFIANARSGSASPGPNHDIYPGNRLPTASVRSKAPRLQNASNGTRSRRQSNTNQTASLLICTAIEGNVPVGAPIVLSDE